MFPLIIEKGNIIWLLTAILSIQSAFAQEQSVKQEWYGCVNTLYAFEMVLEAEEGPFFSGRIQYKDIDISYELAAQLRDGKMIIHELDEQSDIAGRFELEVMNGKGQGIWQDAKASFAFDAHLSLDPSFRCKQLKSVRYQLSSEIDRNGILWLSEQVDGSRKGRFWNEQAESAHDFLIFNSGDNSYSFCDTLSWEGYKPEEDPLALELEIIHAINSSKGNEGSLIDFAIYDFGRAFTDSCLDLLNRNIEDILPENTGLEERVERWQNRYYLNTEIDLWNNHYICGSLEIIGQKGTVDAMCFIYDREESTFRNITYFLKSKYIDQRFDKEADFEVTGISMDQEGLIVKGNFSPLEVRKIIKHDWRTIKKYFKGKLLDKLLETR